jgi:hypothetical protein
VLCETLGSEISSSETKSALRYVLIRVDTERRMSTRFYSIAAAARQIGVSAITLKRWLLKKKVDEVVRNRNGWRVFSDADIRRIKAFADKKVPPKGKR